MVVRISEYYYDLGAKVMLGIDIPVDIPVELLVSNSDK